MAGRIFVNYRRDDAKAEAARLHDKLAQTYGAADVFMDVDNLLPGERFDLKLKEALAETDIFLAVIGARWQELFEARAASGQRDYVREEIAAALARKIVVIPVPMDRAALPQQESLPPDIRELVLYHKQDVAHESFGRDVAALVSAIEAHRQARDKKAADAVRLAREKELGEIEAARRARQEAKEAAEAERRAQAKQRQAQGRQEPAAVPWMPAAVIVAVVAVVAAGLLILQPWSHNPASVPAPLPPELIVANPPVAVQVSAPKAGESFKDCSDCPEMVTVPAGSFTMGSPSSEAEHHADESPQHRVTIAKPFAVGRFAVTFAEWDACVAGGGCGGYKPEDSGWGRGDRPVINVSWNDAKAYVKWLSGKTGKDYRLLSEAEREYVTRAGTQTPFWWGSSISTELANYDGNYTYNGSQKGEYRNKTLPVKSFKPNPWGLYQVHGNVYDWVEDCWHGNYEGAPADGSAWTTGDCSFRVLRGGSWVSNPQFLRAALRSYGTPDVRSGDVGFRVALGWQDLNR